MRDYSFTNKVLAILTVIFLIPAFVLSVLGALEVISAVAMGVGSGLYIAAMICFITSLILRIVEISKM